MVAAHELRWLSRGWLGMGAVILVAAVASRSLGDLTGIEVAACALVFALALGGAVGGLVLGVRTGPPILYRRIFDLAPAPPPEARGENPAVTARRAVGTSLMGSAFLIAGAAFLVPLTMVLLGRPKHALLDHLPQAVALVASCWMIATGTIASRVSIWFRRWEEGSERLVLCAPLHSGLLRHVYYAAKRAE